MRLLVVGSGFSGSVAARAIAEAGHQVDVVDGRDHVAGNCHTERDDDTGVMVHRYGPHLFHTRHRRVVDYLERFTELRPNQHRVRATSRSGIYSMPLNLLSMNQFFGTRHGPAAMRRHVAADAESIEQPANFEEQALAMMGRALYEEFFEGYTIKQWGRSPRSLPASILKRLPMRFEYDDRYFADPYEFLPADGYTAVVERVLDHELISVQLGCQVTRADTAGYDHVVWSGPIDAWFDHSFGRLPYRTLDFQWSAVEHPHQGCSVMNYTDASVSHTRIAEHSYFEPWRATNRSIIGVETSREAGPNDIPYYPIRLAEEFELLREYLGAARQTRGVTFVGRLGTYRYVDMDSAILEALDAADQILHALGTGAAPPVFCVNPDAGQH